MGFVETRGDLLLATEQYIVHQCCCTAVRPHGLAAALFTRWPDADVYARRRRIAPSRNLAVPQDRGVPGTIVVSGARRIISAFGQVEMGAPGRFSMDGRPDTAADRERYFAACLEAIAALQPTSLAFPARIGCGLAGGNWTHYARMLRDFAAAHPATRVVVYCL